MNIEKARLRSRKHYWAHRDELSPKKKIKRLQRLYGLSFEQVEQMYISQNGRCAICEEELESTWDICVDHDHQNGKVRGLLCRVHNTVLGMANDDTSLFLKAVAYLDKWKKFHNQSTNERENKC